VVLHHVAQRAGAVVEIDPAFQADGFGDRDLDMGDGAAFQSGSNRMLAKRSASRFWTVSLPR
jgi:hypothetical protein